MLARKAVVGQVKSDVLVIAQGRRRSANVALDLSPMMWQVVYGIAALVVLTYYDGYECIQYKVGL
ncbi:MAG: hypothetical protein ACLRZ2_06960 [Veillonella sp.]